MLRNTMLISLYPDIYSVSNLNTGHIAIKKNLLRFFSDIYTFSNFNTGHMKIKHQFLLPSDVYTIPIISTGNSAIKFPFLFFLMYRLSVTLTRDT